MAIFFIRFKFNLQHKKIVNKVQVALVLLFILHCVHTSIYLYISTLLSPQMWSTLWGRLLKEELARSRGKLWGRATRTACNQPLKTPHAPWWVRRHETEGRQNENEKREGRLKERHKKEARTAVRTVWWDSIVKTEIWDERRARIFQRKLHSNWSGRRKRKEGAAGWSVYL